MTKEEVFNEVLDEAVNNWRALDSEYEISKADSDERARRREEWRMKMQINYLKASGGC